MLLQISHHVGVLNAEDTAQELVRSYLCVQGVRPVLGGRRDPGVQGRLRRRSRPLLLGILGARRGQPRPDDRVIPVHRVYPEALPARRTLWDQEVH